MTEMKKRSFGRKGSWKPITRRILQWPFGIFSVVLLYIAWRVVARDLSLDSAIAALMLVAAAAVFMVLSRQDLIRLVRRLEKIGPVGFTAADAESPSRAWRMTRPRRRVDKAISRRPSSD